MMMMVSRCCGGGLWWPWVVIVVETLTSRLVINLLGLVLFQYQMVIPRDPWCAWALVNEGRDGSIKWS